MNNRVVLTGGGTAGHVTPNIALLPGLAKMGFEVYYIGGRAGMEAALAHEAGLPYISISAGKLRRYISLKNITDPFRVIKGFGDAFAAVRKIRPAVVFSKGGFVTVPVAAACAACLVPFILHEGDISPGLANRLAAPFAKKVCVTFPEAAAKFGIKKAVVTGAPIRAQIYGGSKIEGLRVCGFSGIRPVLLCIGGSLGSAALNAGLRAALPALIPQYDIIHITGKGAVNPELGATANNAYKQFEYVGGELPHLFAAADIVLSRAGSSAINELLALRKPNLLVPLSKRSSRGDQILNAHSFEKRGFSAFLDEDDLNADTLVAALGNLFTNRGKYIAAMKANGKNDAIERILEIIKETAKDN